MRANKLAGRLESTGMPSLAPVDAAVISGSTEGWH
jgi:hypothetical protein